MGPSKSLTFSRGPKGCHDNHSKYTNPIWIHHGVVGGEKILGHQKAFEQSKKGSFLARLCRGLYNPVMWDYYKAFIRMPIKQPVK